MRRAGGGGVTAGRVLRSPVRRRAALVGGGIAAAPKVHTGGTRPGKHAPPARPVRTLAVRALRVFALCASAAHACVPVLCARCTCAVSSTCACSSPCLLRVPMRCVLELCTLVLGVWCTCAAFAQIVRHPLVNVVDIAGVHRPVLSAGLVHACFVRACASHACVACTCCVCVCSKFALCALALPMLALRVLAVCALPVRACAVRFRAVCGVLVQRSSTSCGARRLCIPVDPGDLP